MPDNLNVSIYEDIARLGMKRPDIAVPHTASYGQCGEDVVVCAALRALAFSEGFELSAQSYLEIGANHPVATSATWLLHEKLGMRGVLVEANPDLLDDLKQHRTGDRIVHAAIVADTKETAHLFVSSKNELSSINKEFVTQWPGDPVELSADLVVPALRINNLISEHMAGTSPLFLSIDVEGADFFIIKDLDFTRFRPAVIQIEPSDHFRVNNSQEISDFLCEQSYMLIGRTDVNLIFADATRLPLVQKRSAELHSAKAAQQEAEEKTQRLQERLAELSKHFLKK